MSVKNGEIAPSLILLGQMTKKKNTQIRVVHVCETIKGGVATYLNMIGVSLSGTTRNVAIVPERQSQELYGVQKVVTFPEAGRGVRRLVSLFKHTIKVLRSERPDILFFHSTFTLPILAMLRLWGVKAKFIYCPHGWAGLRYESASLKRWVVSKIEGSLCGLSTVVVNISQYEMQYACCVKYLGDQRLIENAVLDVKQSKVKVPLVKNETCINMLFVGRFDLQKGLDVLLDAYRQVKVYRSDIFLHIVGESVLNNYRSLQETITNDVSFYGWLSPEEVNSFYQQADLVVVPSRWEGFGLVVVEAYRAGTPVMVSDRGALPGLVVSNETGYVVPLSVDDFKDSIRKLNKYELIAMRKNCRKLYEQRFNAERFAQELNELYRELLET